jgi:DNA modification methylase
MKKVNQKGPTIAAFRLSELKPAGYNPRVISDDAMKGLTASLNRFGCVEPIVVNCRGGKKTIIGGHQRYKALVDLYGKDYECPCVTVDLSARDEKLLNMALNNPHIQGEFSEDLAVMIDQLRAEMPGDDALLDLRIEELRAGISEQLKEGLIDDDDVPEPPKKSITKMGDLWIMGDHRVLCGDSTKAEDIARLMNGEKADMVFTDPPYNVNFIDNTRQKRKTAGDNQIPEDYKLFIKQSAGLLYVLTKQITCVYCCFASASAVEVIQAYRETNWKDNQWIIWVKDIGARRLTHAYRWRFEPILYLIKNNTPVFYGDNSTETNVWEMPSMISFAAKKDDDTLILNNQSENLHPNRKPVPLCQRAIRNSSKDNDIIFDGFLGSGTTLIAAAKLNRRCYGLEIEPGYCDVIVKRWEEWTGKKAILEREAGSVKREMEKSKRPGRKGGYKSPKKGKQGQPGATGAK